MAGAEEAEGGEGEKGGAEEEEGDEDEDEDEDDEDEGDDGGPSIAVGAVVVRDETPVVPIDVSATIEAVPAALRGLVLRALAVVDDERCGAAFAAAEPEHPWSLYRAYQASEGRATDRALLWRCIAAAPGWAAPYLTLRDDEDEDVDEIDPLAPTSLEEVSAAGLGALLAPDDGEAAEIAGDRLDDDGRTAEALRAARRAVALDPDDADRHLALLALHTDAERLGTWLAEAHRAGARHGCPMDPYLPWYPDQRKIDLAVATALMNVGRLDEAIALRQNRVEGVEATWTRHTSILQQWRRDPSFVAWSYAREAHARGDDGRVVEGFGRMAPEDGVDLGMLLDGLVATGREREAPLVWAWFGIGCNYAWPYARLSAARALAAAGSWAEALRQLVLAQVHAPARDDHAALAHVARLFAVAPIDELAAIVRAHLDAGARTIARRVAREIADVSPHAAGNDVIRRALGAPTAVAFDPAWLAPLARLPDAATRAALDAAFAALASSDDGDALAAGDRLVTSWVALIPVATMEDPHAAARGFAIAGAQALARYLCATAQAPSPRAGALRTVAAEAFTAAAAQRHLLRDAELLAVLEVLEPAVAIAEPILADGWLAFVERCLGLDERWHGALDRAAAVAPGLTARLCGPEQLAMLGWRAAAEIRHKPEGWAARAAPTLERLAWLTGGTGASEWAVAIDELATANAIDATAAIDALSTAHYLVSHHDATPTVRLAHRLFAAGRAEDAFARLCEGLPAAGEDWRDAQIATFRAAWKQAKLDVPIDFERAAGAVFTALQKGDPARAERVGRWCVALDPENQEAHRNLGLAFANQGKVAEALAHLVKATPEQATQILSGVLYQAGKLPEAMAVLDVASRWYTRCDQWLTFGGVAYAAMDNPRTVLAYDRAWQLDRDGIDASQLNAYAGVLDEVGDFARCEVVARRLIEVAGKDKTWLTNGWNHLPCALLGQGKQKEAIELATRAVKQNPLARQPRWLRGDPGPRQGQHPDGADPGAAARCDARGGVPAARRRRSGRGRGAPRRSVVARAARCAARRPLPPRLGQPRAGDAAGPRRGRADPRGQRWRNRDRGRAVPRVRARDPRPGSARRRAAGPARRSHDPRCVLYRVSRARRRGPGRGRAAAAAVRGSRGPAGHAVAAGQRLRRVLARSRRADSRGRARRAQPRW